MYPILFQFDVVGTTLTIYSYGFMIVTGAVLGVLYLWRMAKKYYQTSFDTINTLFLLLLLAGFIGGKFFLIFENPAEYLRNPGALLSGQGFVFYGSLIFCIPTMLLFFRNKNLPVRPMLDIMAIVTCIVHFFGRIGCFLAGCCYGVETHGVLGIIFHDPLCLARPLNTPLHPTQLYSAVMILLILITLLYLKGRKMFDGQVFLTYLMLYAVGRSIVEIFRGDMSRGYIITDVLSNSQGIAIIIFMVTAYFYMRWRNKYKIRES
jgi:phosphatidylglycerol---prolipoprotein diacylglyceryl transferase